MEREKATVPIPTGPPSRNPMISTVISILARMNRILFPVFLLNPSIRLSRGPAPRLELIYNPVPIAMRIMPVARNTNRKGRRSMEEKKGVRKSMKIPISTILSIVPIPGMIPRKYDRMMSMNPVIWVIRPRERGR